MPSNGSNASDATASDGHRGPIRRLLLPAPLPPPVNPALVQHSEQRAKDVQNRIADKITAFAGSMTFVYMHVLWFGLWIGLGAEKYPYGLLTMIVSLEAIFLSTFVMIGQNRQADFQQAKAEHDFNEQELELKTNTELTRDIDRLTTELHKRLLGHRTGTEK